MRRIAVVIVGSLCIVALFWSWAMAQGADTTEPDIEWRIVELPYVQSRPLQLGLEAFFGLGNHGNLAQLRPSDSTQFNLDRFGAWFQFRSRFYIGPVGLVSFFDGFLDPVGVSEPNESEIGSDASSTSFQILGSFPLELFYYHYHVEAYFGYGWMTDWARSRRGTEGNLYEESLHGKGQVWGCEQTIRFGRGYQLRGIYTYGDYKVFDKRMKVEVQWGTDSMPIDSWNNRLKKRGGSFVSLGYHRVWKGDGRTDDMIYIGMGVRGRL